MSLDRESGCWENGCWAATDFQWATLLLVHISHIHEVCSVAMDSEGLNSKFSRCVYCDYLNVFIGGKNTTFIKELYIMIDAERFTHVSLYTL